MKNEKESIPNREEIERVIAFVSENVDKFNGLLDSFLANKDRIWARKDAKFFVSMLLSDPSDLEWMAASDKKASLMKKVRDRIQDSELADLFGSYCEAADQLSEYYNKKIYAKGLVDGVILARLSMEDGTPDLLGDEGVIHEN